MIYFLQQRNVRRLLKSKHFLLALFACSLFIHVLNRRFDLIDYDWGFDLRLAPWEENSLSLTTHVLQGIDFSRLSSVFVRLRKDTSSTLFLIPDYNDKHFQCARLSNSDLFDSRYIGCTRI